MEVTRAGMRTSTRKHSMDRTSAREFNAHNIIYTLKDGPGNNRALITWQQKKITDQSWDLYYRTTLRVFLQGFSWLWTFLILPMLPPSPPPAPNLPQIFQRSATGKTQTQISGAGLPITVLRTVLSDPISYIDSVSLSQMCLSGC